MRVVLAALAAVALLVGGCSSDDSPLPDGATLIKDAAAAAGRINSTHFTLRTNGSVPGLNVQKLDGDLTKTGPSGAAAKGNGTMALMGQLVSAEFVLANGTLYVKGPTGGFQPIPAALGAAVYDPAAVLDPNRGLPKALASVQNPAAVAREEVDGANTIKVTGKAAKGSLSGVLPGVNAEPDVTVWVRDDPSRQPVKLSAAFPGNGSVDVTLSDVDKPVTVHPPA